MSRREVAARKDYEVETTSGRSGERPPMLKWSRPGEGLGRDDE